ncbi:MAG: metallophosphoesterase family protein [Bryobacterales bacterium]|nr:metallophosphatase family protein [Bryobacteraceae bacterium]MDW8129346.1 metallophosphoesterase family protein [Bryobacterales bacterium]
MRYLVLSDIHSNWEALEAVLRHAGGAHDAIVCLGDLVGYGADPNRVVEWARKEVSVAIRGNHDKAAVGLLDPAWFNPAAREAAEWTASVLTPENYAYLRRLPRGPLSVGQFQIMHGHPADEDEYLWDLATPDDVLPFLARPLAFFGHTHIQGGFRLRRGAVSGLEDVAEGEAGFRVALLPGWKYLINPGSVGQPRDGDPRAAYAIFDTEAAEVELRRCVYAVEVAQAKILRAGLPAVLAERLKAGV